jgi:hypothetical protein
MGLRRNSLVSIRTHSPKEAALVHLELVGLVKDLVEPDRTQIFLNPSSAPLEEVENLGPLDLSAVKTLKQPLVSVS